MTEQTFLIAFDTNNPMLNVLAVRDAIKSHPALGHWWNYLPGVFLVTAAIDADQVAEHLRPVADGVRFLVIAVQPEQSEGWLPEKSWGWIKRREKERSALAKPA